VGLVARREGAASAADRWSAYSCAARLNAAAHPGGRIVSRVRFLPLVVGALIVALIVPAGAAAKPPTQTPVTVPITGTTATGAPVTGTFEITRFATQGGGIVALGTFTGTAGTATGSQAMALPVTVLQATCEILRLELGPLHLDLLGLVVDLNRVVLVITAESGPGNLLGNLLCAIAGLLDPGPGGPLSTIVGLLNRILMILQSI
jgi:hypothetical protein